MVWSLIFGELWVMIPSKPLTAQKWRTKTMTGTLNRLNLIESAWQRQAVGQRKTMVFSGLSVTIVGHLVKVKVDQESMIGKVVVEPLPGSPPPTKVELAAIRSSAKALEVRARRLLVGWKIIPLDQGEVPRGETVGR